MYIVSDVTRFFVYRIFKYRKDVVMTNLINSFPEKSDHEIRALCDRFYVFFFDLFFETIKTLTVSSKAIRRRVSFECLPVFEKYANRGQSVILAMGHFGNWELAGARFSQEDIHQLIAIYKPLRNKRFDSLLMHMRLRHGTGLYKMKSTFAQMREDVDKLTAVAFIADQTPAAHRQYWTHFLNQETAVFVGMESAARTFNLPVIYLSPRRSKRGYYEMVAEVLVDDPHACAENEIIDRYVAKLEQEIKLQPEIWLWTHRRWKRKRVHKTSPSPSLEGNR